MTLQNINEMGLDLVKKYRDRISQRQLLREQARAKTHFLAVLSAAKADVILKRNHFDYATDEKLMDCCIYELKAAESRLNYYLVMAKRENMINDEYADMLFYKREFERGVGL